ncbi:MAG TPA: hypothetical protein ENN36_06560 [Candidatus Bathyarchaeota archaeon]|nr:hypothetical protein [Candidatus Bathyarchaeota archaeon]
MSEDKLGDFLKSGKDWARLKTTVPGIFVLKLPPYRSSPTRLAVELNPVNEMGNPKKRHGIILRSTAEFEEFKELLNDEKLTKLVGMIDSVNPAAGVVRRKKGEEVIDL